MGGYADDWYTGVLGEDEIEVGASGATEEADTWYGVTMPQLGQKADPTGICVPHELHCINHS